MRKLYIAAAAIAAAFAAQAAPLQPVSLPAPAPASRADAPDPITDMPEGRTVQMERSSNQFLNQFGTLICQKLDGGVAEVTFADDGKVYFKNIMSCMKLYRDVWTVGELGDDGTVSVTFPQAVYASLGDTDMIYYTACVYDDLLNNGDEPQIPTYSDNQTITFTYADGVLTQTDDRIIGLDTETGGPLSFMGYGDGANVFKPFDRKPQAMPEGVATETWALTSDEEAREITVARDGGDFYFTGLSESVPEAVVRGTVKGDKVVIETGQYVGVYKGIYYVYVVAVKGEQATTQAGEPRMNYVRQDAVELDFNEASRAMRANKDEGFCLNAGNGSVMYVNLYANVNIYARDTDLAATPATPSGLKIEELDPAYWSDYGYAEFSFTLPLVGTQGELLDADKLFYNMYLDNDELFTFTPAVYKQLTADMVDVPSNFYENYDFFIFNGTNHVVYLWDNNFDRVGVQAIYRGGGEERRSPIIYSDGEIGVEDVRGDEASPVYYDLTGRRVDCPSHGVYVKVSGGKAIKVAM